MTEFGPVANQSNAVTGIYGISGSGKSNLADTGIEYCWEVFQQTSLVYAADLGGFGNKRLALIRAGIARVYDPRNHVDPFSTMELISLGAFPETILDPERGYADPHVKLILPRRVMSVLYCPNGHEVARDDNAARLAGMMRACPTCGTLTNFTNASKVDSVVVRHHMFKRVGFRVYDSFTALNEWGMQDLQEQSAKGTLPASSQGGSLLGAADALRSGQFTFGSSSIGQYGFLQNRTYGWLSNIRKIEDQVVPAVATFHVEQSKGNDESGGDLLLGPKIAGNARTAALPGWLGNCLHATKEPYAPDDQRLVYRLWLTNHIDPRDPRKIPYVAKHRGTPLGMPDYLEDKPGAEPWSGFSLNVLFRKLQTQLDQLDAEAKAKYPNAPAFAGGEAEENETDEVVAAVSAATIDPIAVPVTGGRSIGGPRRRRAVAAMPDPAASNAGTPLPLAAAGAVGDSAVPVPANGGDASAPPAEASVAAVAASPSPIVEQLNASLAARAAETVAQSGNGADVIGTSTSAPAAGGVVSLPAVPSTTQPPPPTGAPVSRIRRVPRPPTTV